MCNEIKRYQELNKIAEPDGIVIFGGTSDKEIPLCELKQAFELNGKLYNRSVDKLSVTNAEDIYNTCIAPIQPEIVLLHIGESDIELFEAEPSQFDNMYRSLISCIKKNDKHCSISIISLKNPENNPVISELNKHLRYIAQSEHCEFGDITSNRVWNPKETKDVLSFVYSLGLVQPFTTKRSTYDLTKILFCYNTCGA